MLSLQRFPAEAVLAILLLVLFLLVLRAVRRRHAIARLPVAADLPYLETQQRITGTIRRVFRDPAQGVQLVVVEVGGLRLTFCAVDRARAAERYQGLLGRSADIALFALATLEPGGIEAMKHQIKDSDKIDIHPDRVLLTAAGEFPNDYVVVGRVHAAREDAWGEMPLTVYRTEVLRRDNLTLILDLAVPRSDAPFPSRSLVHGSARLFGYLPEA